ncbi:hypothetical protein ACFL0R_01070 [Pseudomonadota bacterium]
MNTTLDLDKRIIAEELDNWSPLDVHVWSSYSEVNGAVDHLFDLLSQLPQFSGNKIIRKKHIKVVILDLYAKWLVDPTMYCGYYRAVNHYSNIEARYNKLHISKLTIKIVDALHEAGYITHFKGHYGREGGGSSHMSRMRATEQLIGLIIDQHSMQPEMIERVPNTESVILRNEDKDDVDYEETDVTRRMRRLLCEYNNVLRSNHIGLPHTAKQGTEISPAGKRVHINQRDKFVRRIFNNNSWGEGGRFYGGWWQIIPKSWREDIRINGVPTVELDYSSFHIIMLYHLEGIDYLNAYDVDPYLLPCYESSKRMRGLLKQVLLSAICAKDRQAALRGIRKEVNFNPEEYGWVKEEGLDIELVISEFEKQHPVIGKYFFSGFGVRLQYIDSLIAGEIVERYTDEGIPVLCIHDSFIVPVQYEEDLRGVMESAYRSVMSSYCAMPQVNLKTTIADDDYQWGRYMHDSTSLYGYVAAGTGDAVFDEEAKRYSPDVYGYEEYYI